MINNTFQHISSESKYVSFDPSGTNYPSTVVDVQTALSMTSPTSDATETGKGVIKIATLAEVTAGTDTKSAVTPFTLAQRLKYPGATTTAVGVIQLATNAEAQTGTDTSKAIVPSSLKYTIDWVFTNRLAKEATTGVIKIATTAGAQAGTDDTTAMTPLKVKLAIAAATSQIPSYTTATETDPGLVQLATAGQMSQGTARSGVAVSPYSLAQMTGNLTRKGIVQAATSAQANAGTDDGLYISAKGFKTYSASTSNAGTVKLTDTPGTVGTGLALSSMAKVLSTASSDTQTVSGTVNYTEKLQVKGSNVLTESAIDDHMPVGSIVMWGGSSMPSDNWEVAVGQSKSKADYALLYSRYAGIHGEDSTTFKCPDLRGMFVRGVGASDKILAERGKDGKGKDKLGVGVSGGPVGTVQMQMQRKHKHALGDGDFNRGWFVFGASIKKGYGGGRNRLWDSNQEFTNDGTEIDDEAIRDEIGTLNSKGFIGDENRPWNMSLYYIIKVK